MCVIVYVSVCFLFLFFFLMIRRPPRSTRTDTLFPYRRSSDLELKGTAYAVVDGTDGRTHHIKLPDLDAAGDSAPGSIVELRKFDDAQGRGRVALAVRS